VIIEGYRGDKRSAFIERRHRVNFDVAIPFVNSKRRFVYTYIPKSPAVLRNYNIMIAI